VKRRDFLGAGALVALSACSSSRKLPELPRLAAERGSMRWSVDLDGGGYGFAPAIVGDRVYAAGRDGTLARMALADGTVDWRVDVDVRLVTGVGAVPGLLAVADENGTLRVLDDDGALRWKAQLGAAAVSIPVLEADVWLVGGGANGGPASDALTGRRRGG